MFEWLEQQAQRGRSRRLVPELLALEKALAGIAVGVVEEGQAEENEAGTTTATATAATVDFHRLI